MKTGLFYAGITGLSGVMLGAFGAHVLKDTLAARGAVSIWETAVHYQLTHSVASLAVALFVATRPVADGKWFARAVTFWLIGTGLFSGSLYLLALGGPKWLGPVTPLGGIFLLAGWACVITGSLKAKTAGGA